MKETELCGKVVRGKGKPPAKRLLTKERGWQHDKDNQAHCSEKHIQAK